MGGLVVSGLSAAIQSVMSGLLGILAQMLGGMSDYALQVAHLPWVSQAVDVSTAVAGGLLLLNLTYRAATEYVLWNEGSSSDGTGTLGKGLLRVAIYGAAGTTIAYTTFQWGIWLAMAYMAAPLLGNVTVTHNLVTDLASVPNVTMGAVLALTFGLVAVVVALVVVALQMAVRATELIYYVVGAPIVALGQFNRDGGVWSAWWRNLVILSLSQAVQWLGLKSMVGMTQVILGGTASVASSAQMLLVILLMLGAAIATIRGPHMLQQWSYRSGFAGMGGQVGSIALQQYVGRALGK